MKTHCQNQLKIAGLTYFEVFYKTRHKKIQVMTLLHLSNATLRLPTHMWATNLSFGSSGLLHVHAGAVPR